MTLAESIYQHSRNLPEQAAREALDFVEFLEQRYAKEAGKSVSSGDTEAFLAAVTGTLGDDFPDDVSDDDLGTDAKRVSLECSRRRIS